MKDENLFTFEMLTMIFFSLILIIFLPTKEVKQTTNNCNFYETEIKTKMKNIFDEKLKLKIKN